MKKALAVINGYIVNPNNEYKIQRLREELKPYGVALEVKDAISLLPLCQGNKIQIPDWETYLFAIDLDKDIYLAKVLSLALPLFNSYESMVLSDDKMLSILALKESGISVPDTIPAPLCYVTSPVKDKRKLFLDQVEKSLSYPLVFKECHGSLGRQVELIHSRQELEETEEKYAASQHLYERFLAKHQGNDYRVMVVGSKVVAVMERKNDHDFRSNIALGGVGKDVTDIIPLEYKEIAIRACQALKLDYAGIDIGMDQENNPVFLEANGNAFFTEIEKVCHVNVAKALVEHILSKLQ